MSDTMCCPLSYDENESSAEFFDQKVVKAKKPHKCYECGEDIKVGDKYERTSGKWEGTMSVFCTCLLCKEIRDHFACDKGYMFGELWQDLHDNFFPEMKAGGPCLDGLSPAAKQSIIDARMEWYFEQGEVDDSKWKDWAAKRPITG